MVAPVLLALEALAAMGARAAPRLAGAAMRGSAATERAEKIARAARGTQSMEGANRGFTLVGKPQFGTVTPAGPVTTPPGSAVALRGSTTPATSAAPSGGAMTAQGQLLADPRMQRLLNTTGAAGATGAAVLSESPTSLLDYLPQRAEGDPAGAIGRRNAPVDFGMSDAAYRFKDLPGYEGEGMAGGVGAMRFSDDVRSETPGRAMTGGYTDDGQAAYAAAARKAVPLARQVTQAAAAGPSSKSLYDEYNQSMMDEGGGRADLFERARRAEMEEAKGRASGGKVGASNAGAGGKDAAIHKALEIIHHHLTQR